jgi:hypothetical protein
MAANPRLSGVWAAGRDEQAELIGTLVKPARFAAASVPKTLVFG